jgi:hypothetical protein
MPDYDSFFELAAEYHIRHAGELITYTPPSGSARSIYAVVSRNDPAPDGFGVCRPSFSVSVRNSATYGIGSSEAFRGGTLTLARRQGHAENVILVLDEQRLKTQGPGALTFEWD